ncbi:DUF4234 domain-containing protein [Nocardia cyriacigeorgica]|uniref:DUF4234 domain-containing protein n=1 Tax=Nocardia cyriacigeorgica TaxID=135487 RepID=UPI001108A9E3|nr:DUF4234 domain-containing protein [Nocardia cyriacigeorgica]TLF57017.1 hypothetical protein FEK31_15340 [Nocardia cyriacigeorgica]
MNPQPPGNEQRLPRQGAHANSGMPMHTVSLEHRQQLLMMAVSAQAGQGAKVMSMTQTSAVLLQVDQTNHILHILLSVVTCGLWLIVYVIQMNTAKIRRYQIYVDEYGMVHYLPPPHDQG